MTLRKQALFRRLMNQAGDEGSDTGGTDAVDVVEGGEDVGQDKPEGEPEAEAKDPEGEPDEVVVSIGEEAPTEEPVHAPDWVRELRKTNRELQRQNRELQSKLQAPAPTEKQIVVGKKPTLEAHDYDGDAYEAALTTWFENKRQADDEVAKKEAEAIGQQKEWQSKIDSYGKAKSELKVSDFDDAEAVAQELFSVTQQGVVLQVADNPALVIYALGKSPKKAQELSAIKDSLKFAFAIAKLETQLKVTSRKPAPPPERIVTGSGRVSGSSDSMLERLRAEAAKTGDMTKVMQYKASKKK